MKPEQNCWTTPVFWVKKSNETIRRVKQEKGYLLLFDFDLENIVKENVTKKLVKNTKELKNATLKNALKNNDDVKEQTDNWFRKEKIKFLETKMKEVVIKGRFSAWFELQWYHEWSWSGKQGWIKKKKNKSFPNKECDGF